MATISVRTDEETKTQAEMLFKSMGMTVSTAMNLFLKQALRLGKIPFDIVGEVPNKVTMAAIEASENDDEMYGPFKSVDEMMEALNA